MKLLVDIGNTHSHIGLANVKRVTRHSDLPTSFWNTRNAGRDLSRFVGSNRITTIALCSVVPDATPTAIALLQRSFNAPVQELNARTIVGISVDYPKPDTIGPDRLANALAARHHYGAPAVVIDFGTAVTFDVVDRTGSYVGGIIAPGMSVMTDYLHEKTALLPRIKLRDTRSAIGKSTEEAMRVGAVQGYRGLIRELIRELKSELGARKLPVIATGGYSRLFERNLREITAVEPKLTLEGLRLFLALRAQSGLDES